MKIHRGKRKRIVFSAKDTFITLFIFIAASLCCLLLRYVSQGDVYVSMIFLMAVFLVSAMTDGYFYGTAASLISVFAVNYAFTYPYMEFNFSLSGYPLTFVTMMIVAVVTGTITSRLKEQEQIKAEAENERIRGNLLRSVSHDLRTPLTAIIGTSELLLENGQEMGWQDKKALIKGISEDAGWLLSVVENLLSITRIESSGTSLRLRQEMIEEIVGSAAAKFKKWHPGQSLAVKMDGDMLMADMDGVLIEQVLINLLDNAVRHSAGADSIVLEVRRQEDQAVFKVIDNGKGIANDEMEGLFSGLKRAENYKTDRGGSMGVGLSVCRTIIKAHNGRIFAGNMPQGGAIFMFTLPLTEVCENVDQ